MKTSHIILCACTAWASTAQGSAISLKSGEPFIQARSKLYGAGWRADPQSHAAIADYSGVERRLLERGYLEVDSCSMGKTFCIFQYKRESSCLRLYTEGEQISAMVVDSWSRKCRQRGLDEPARALPSDIRYMLQWRD